MTNTLPLASLGHSKPSVRVVTVKGKRYLQVRNVDGTRISLGSTSQPETWSMAYSALKEQYDFLCNDELLKLVPVASQDLPKEVNAVSVMLREPGAEAWKILIAKMNLAFHRHQISLATLKAAGFQFLQHGWRIIEDPVELADYSKNGKSAAMILQELQDTYQSRKAAVHHLVRGAEVLARERGG